MGRRFLSRGWFFIVMVFLVFGFCGVGHSVEQGGEEANRPLRLVEMAVEYDGVEVPVEEAVSMDVIFYNRGRSNEMVDVGVSEVAEGWTARIKTYRYTVMGVAVPAGEDKRVTFEAEPGEGEEPGVYEFTVKAHTPDGVFQMSRTITVRVTERGEGVSESKGVKLTTSYPVLRGASDAKFEFSLEVDSQLAEDAVFDLYAKGPEGWEVNFKPAYESKYISSVRLQANQKQTVAVEVKPPVMAQAGQYPVDVRVSSGEAKAEVELTVVLTGTYKLEVGTPTGLLSLDARQGKSANMSVYVKNTGSAANHNIKFMTFKPENWTVKYNPESIDVIEPGDLKQVEVSITPYEEALVGDYSVGLDVQGEKATKSVEFRVMVKASTAWGWIGIGIIVGVIVGLTGLFRWLGRR